MKGTFKAQKGKLASNFSKLPIQVFKQRDNPIKKFDKTGPKTISFKNYMEDTLEGLWMKGASSLSIIIKCEQPTLETLKNSCWNTKFTFYLETSVANVIKRFCS